METKTQIVTQLVAAMLSNSHDYKSYSYTDTIKVACELADEIINQTTEEIAFPERVV